MNSNREHAHFCQCEVLALKAADDLADQPAGDAVRLDHDVRTLNCHDWIYL